MGTEREKCYTAIMSTLSMRGTRDMTKGSPSRLMVGFALPILLSQIFQQLYNTADAFIVGKYLSTASLAAVTSSGPLIFLLTSFFIGMAQGAGVTISRYFGAGDHEKVSRAIHTNLVFGLICGVALSLIGSLLAPVLLGLMNLDPAILPKAVEYFRYYFIGSAAMVMYNVCRGIMNALGDSKRPLIFLIISSLLNILLDWLFVGVFGWDVWAAAVATVISQLTSVVLCLIVLSRKGKVYSVSWRKLRLHKDMLLEIIRYGLPGGVQNSVIAIANVLVQSQINSFGLYATTEYGVYSKLEGFAFLPITSFTMAISTFVGQNLGAGQVDRAKKGARFGILSSMILAETIGIVFFFTAKHLVALFDASPEVLALGEVHARITSLFFCLLAFSHAIAAVCRGAGKAVVPMCIMLAVWCVLRVVYIVVVMQFVHRIEMIYWAYPITWSVSSVIYFFYYKFSNWTTAFARKTQEPPDEEQPDEARKADSPEARQVEPNEEDVASIFAEMRKQESPQMQDDE